VLAERNVEVFGLEVPYSDRLTVEEREALELLSVRAATEALADSRQKYEALRIFAKERLGRELPAWRSKLFDEHYRKYFEDYHQVETAINDLLRPFYAEVDAKKARRQAEALAAAGNASALRAIIRAAEMTLEPFYSALKNLESAGDGPS
jgi:hypothetical protein